MRGHLLLNISVLPVLIGAAAALPQVAFPFNSQVPTVARVAGPYRFQIAQATFSQDNDADLFYTLVNAPAWLNLDSQTRTLYGMPGQGDSGSNTFSIAATDALGTKNMGCTLVVNNDASPRITGNISAILAESGVLTGPSNLSLQPNEAFAIAFGKSFFQPGTRPIQAYYATLADHTPLPSWLEFQESSLGFWGIAPGASGTPQSWTVNLMASDVVGFAGVVATFTLTISTNQLAFTPQHENMVAVAGTQLSFKLLMGDLSLNGKAVVRSQIKSAVAQAPSWLSLHNDTLYLDGIPPERFTPQEVVVTVTDVYGDVATKTIQLQGEDASLFAGNIGNMTATAGKLFTYTIDSSTFSQLNLSTTMDLGAASSWLRYDSNTLQLRGTPPINSKSQAVVMTITASSKVLSKKDSQTFGLQVEAAPLGVVPTSTSTTSRSATDVNSSTDTSTATPLGEPIRNASSDHHSINAGLVVGIIIGCLAVIALLAAVAMMLCRRGRDKHPRGSEKPMISKPKPLNPEESHRDEWSRYEGNGETHDLEDGTMAVRDPPPQLVLPLLPPSTTPFPQPENRRSLASSMGENGEAAIQADPNIPVWGRKSTHLHTPHDSYSAATELARNNSLASKARLSQFAKLSPKKRTSKLLHSWHSPQKKGLQSNSTGTVLRQASKRSRMSGLSITRDRSSGGSFNTHGTSLLSARASDFPEPPQSPKRKSRSIPTLSFHGIDNRFSIRLVSRSDSAATDDRPLAEKRQSFIRNRASSSIISPLFASSRRTSNPQEHVSVHGSSLRRGRSQRAMLSASSSLEPQNPPARNPRRLDSVSNSFAPSYSYSNSRLPSRLPSPTRGADTNTIPEDMSDEYTTTNGTTTSSSSRDLRNTRFEAQLVAQLALPRKQRNFVLPGEASPTPPPSSATRGREVARRKWAQRLKRDSKGNPVSQEASPVRLTDVAQRIVQLKNQSSGDTKEHKEDRLSMLVSKDSINGALRKRAREDEAKGQTMAGAADCESEWEDMSNRNSRIGSVLCGGRGEVETDTSKSTFGGKAFI